MLPRHSGWTRLIKTNLSKLQIDLNDYGKRLGYGGPYLSKLGIWASTSSVVLCEEN
jgi:hypothetical protein